MRISRTQLSKVFLSSAATLAAAGAAALLPAPAAHAQTPINPLAPLRAKVGGYFADDYGVMLGASYDLGTRRAALVVPVVYSVYGDAVLGGDSSFLSAGLQARAYLTPGVGGAPRFFAGAGLGVYFPDDGDTGIGGKVFAGADFGTRLFGTLGYHFVPDVDNSLELSIGVRF